MRSVLGKPQLQKPQAMSKMKSTKVEQPRSHRLEQAEASPLPTMHSKLTSSLETQEPHSAL